MGLDAETALPSCFSDRYECDQVPMLGHPLGDGDPDIDVNEEVDRWRVELQHVTPIAQIMAFAELGVLESSA
ncbi:MAG: hypothetical protein NVSMB1_19790 [Polyangiales bacterium]